MVFFLHSQTTDFYFVSVLVDGKLYQGRQHRMCLSIGLFLSFTYFNSKTFDSNAMAN